MSSYEKRYSSFCSSGWRGGTPPLLHDPSSLQTTIHFIPFHFIHPLPHPKRIFLQFQKLGNINLNLFSFGWMESWISRHFDAIKNLPNEKTRQHETTATDNYHFKVVKCVSKVAEPEMSANKSNKHVLIRLHDTCFVCLVAFWMKEIN